MITKTMKSILRGWPVVLLLGTALQASDHGDSTAAANDPVADLLDLYAFGEPFCQAQGGVGCEQPPEELILALTVHRDATGASRFSSGVVYHFYIENDSGQDLQIDCSFSAEQVVSCSGWNGLSVEAPVGQVVVNGDIRVFAGLRDDPSFLDTEALQEFAEVGVLAFSPPGVDHFAGRNVLAIVLGIQTDAFPAGAAPDHNLLKVWAASERTEGAGLNGGFTGSWYNPELNGQGWVVEVASNPAGPDQFVVYFYGYENGEQLWLIGSGPDIEDNMATVEVVRTSGADWGNAFVSDDVTLETVGTMSFEFSDCNTGSVEFTPGDTSLSAFSTNIVRLTNISGRDCQLLAGGQVDRVGRPGTSYLMIPEEMWGNYNTSSDPDTWLLAFGDEIESALQLLDTADGDPENGFYDPQTLAPVFADDRLQVDIQKGQTGGNYFSIESSALVPQDWNIAAGRRPSEDVIDPTLGMVVSAWDPWVTDYVDANDVPFLQAFPFLAEPH